MSFYRLSLKHYSRGKVASIGNHARYISREGRYANTQSHQAYIERTGKYANRREDFIAGAHGNMPHWAREAPAQFWDAADRYGAINARVASELLLGLPRELTREQRITAVQSFVQEHLQNHPYSWAIHEKPTQDERAIQSHCHVMYSPRTIDGIERDPAQFFKRANTREPVRGGAPVNTRLYARETLQRYREDWARTLNRELERAGRVERVDHRSNAARGLDRVPEPKLHWRESQALKRLLAREGYTAREHHLSADQIQRWQDTGRLTERMAIVLEARRLNRGLVRNQEREHPGQGRRAQEIIDASRQPQGTAREEPERSARQSGGMLARIAARLREDEQGLHRQRRKPLERDERERDGWGR